MKKKSQVSIARGKAEMNNGEVVKIKSSIDDGSSKSGDEHVEIDSIHEKFERCV